MPWETYVENCRQTAFSLKGVLPRVDVIAALELIDHGGAVDGLMSLAESVVKVRAAAPASSITAIFELSDGLLPRGKGLPPDLAKHAC
jgi:hypothetical protein